MSLCYQSLFPTSENQSHLPTEFGKAETHLSVREKDINNTGNPSLISYILLLDVDLLLFVSLCVSVHLC